MDLEAKIDKGLGLYQRGLMSEAEVISSFLLGVSEYERGEDVAILIERLPAEIAEGVRARLNELAITQFEWEPFLIGGRLDDKARDRLGNNLQDMHAIVNCSETKP